MGLLKIKVALFSTTVGLSDDKLRGSFAKVAALTYFQYCHNVSWNLRLTSLALGKLLLALRGTTKALAFATYKAFL